MKKLLVLLALLLVCGCVENKTITSPRNLSPTVTRPEIAQIIVLEIDENSSATQLCVNEETGEVYTLNYSINTYPWHDEPLSLTRSGKKLYYPVLDAMMLHKSKTTTLNFTNKVYCAAPVLDPHFFLKKRVIEGGETIYETRTACDLYWCYDGYLSWQSNADDYKLEKAILECCFERVMEC